MQEKYDCSGKDNKERSNLSTELYPSLVKCGRSLVWSRTTLSISTFTFSRFCVPFFFFLFVILASQFVNILFILRGVPYFG
jgi:hypothetical protein